MLFLAVVMDFVLLADIAVVFLFPLKNNHHGTLLACLNCR
jgi:NADH:ubiquinone oxidoreductase subunit 3 (subunit A)